MAITRIGPKHQVTIPQEAFRRLGLKPGDTLVCRSEGDRLILKARQNAEEDLWRSFAQVKGSLSRELIAERRREAKREAES